jgi:hypothetical protein
MHNNSVSVANIKVKLDSSDVYYVALESTVMREGKSVKRANEEICDSRSTTL